MINKKPRASSKGEKEWLDSILIPDDKRHRQVPIKCFTRTFWVDGFDPETNTCYEYLGDYYHYATTRKYLKCQEKFALLMAYGYKVISIWESEWKKLNSGSTPAKRKSLSKNKSGSTAPQKSK
jgi:hypothetical protein